MHLLGLQLCCTDRRCRSSARAALLGAPFIGAFLILVSTPASASAAPGTGGGSVGGFGWSFLIPAAVIGLVVFGALLVTRVERSPGPDPVLDQAEDTEPAEEDTERTHEDPPA